MSRTVCGICWCPYDEDTGECACAPQGPTPPYEAKTEAEKIAYCAGWWAALEKARKVEPVQGPVALNEGRLWQYPDGSIGVGTPAEPVQEPVATMTVREDMGVDFKFHLSHTLRPGQQFHLCLDRRPAEPQEPVAWMYTGIKHDGTTHGPHLVWKPAYMDAMSADKGAKATPLYTAPPQRKPLTEHELNDAYCHIWRNLPNGFNHTASEWIEVSVRYAERVHGIGGSE